MFKVLFILADMEDFFGILLMVAAFAFPLSFVLFLIAIIDNAMKKKINQESPYYVPLRKAALISLVIGGIGLLMIALQCSSH